MDCAQYAVQVQMPNEILCFSSFVLKHCSQGTSSSPVVKTSSNVAGAGSTPDQGSKIPLRCSQKPKHKANSVVTKSVKIYKMVFI